MIFKNRDNEKNRGDIMLCKITPKKKTQDKNKNRNSTQKKN